MKYDNLKDILIAFIPLWLVIIVIIAIAYSICPDKTELTFEEKIQKAYFSCIRSATIDNCPEMLSECEDILKTKQHPTQ